MTFSIFVIGLVVGVIIALTFTMSAFSYEDTKEFKKRQKAKNDPAVRSDRNTPNTPNTSSSVSYASSLHKQRDIYSSSQTFSDSSLLSSSGCYSDSYSSDICSSDSSGCDGGSSGCD